MHQLSFILYCRPSYPPLQKEVDEYPHIVTSKAKQTKAPGAGQEILQNYCSSIICSLIYKDNYFWILALCRS